MGFLLRVALFAAIVYYAYRWFTQNKLLNRPRRPRVGKRQKGSNAQPPLFDPRDVEDIDYREVKPGKPDQNE